MVSCPNQFSPWNLQSGDPSVLLHLLTDTSGKGIPFSLYFPLNHCGHLDLCLFSVLLPVFIIVSQMLILSLSDWLLCPFAEALLIFEGLIVF